MLSTRVRVRTSVSALIAGVMLLGGGSALAAPTAPAPAADQTASAPAACPPTMATSRITERLVGTGWTVTSGDTPRPFRVRILGTLDDGIAPGRDLIVVKVSDLPGERVIAQGKGIWAGMSGSPVYIDGKLAGAISYSFSQGPSRIGGMTPARYMTRITTTYGARTVADATRVRITGTLGRTVARAAGKTNATSATLTRITTPVVVSGGVGRMRNALVKELRSELGPVRVTTGSAAGGGTTLAAAPKAGGNLAGVISFGDVTVSAVGTVTSVCDGVVLGFGHPMTAEGKVAYGAARASALAIIDGLVPYKLANVGRLFGVIDQDRLAGVQARVGRQPRLIPLVARVRSTESGRIRTGTTQVTASDWVPVVAANHLYYDIQATADRVGKGTVTASWTVTGRRADGRTWELRRSDRFASTDAAYDAANALYQQLGLLADNASEQIRFTGITMRATASPTVKRSAIRKVLISRNGGEFRERQSLTVRAGDRLAIRVRLVDQRGQATTQTLRLTVPARAAGMGYLVVAGGSELTTDCVWDPSACGTTFPKLLRTLADAPRGDDLIAALETDDFVGGGTSRTTVARQTSVVTGGTEILVEIR